MKQNEMSEAKVNKLFETYTRNMLEKYQQSATQFTQKVQEFALTHRMVSEQINENNSRVTACTDFV